MLTVGWKLNKMCCVEWYGWALSPVPLYQTVVSAANRAAVKDLVAEWAQG